MARNDECEYFATVTLRTFVSAFSTLADAATQLGVSRQYLWRLLQSRERMSARILKKLKLVRVVVPLSTWRMRDGEEQSVILRWLVKNAEGLGLNYL